MNATDATCRVCLRPMRWAGVSRLQCQVCALSEQLINLQDWEQTKRALAQLQACLSPEESQRLRNRTAFIYLQQQEHALAR